MGVVLIVEDMQMMTRGEKAARTRLANNVIDGANAKKRCPKCTKEKPIEKFGVRVSRVEGKLAYPRLQSYCTDCRGGKLVEGVKKPCERPECSHTFLAVDGSKRRFCSDSCRGRGARVWDQLIS